MTNKLRSKMAFLNYESMLSKITSGELDAYDIIFTPDSKQCYVVSPDLTPWAVHSKVYVFDSTIAAVSQLNKNEDTYAGQIVAILSDDKYMAYIVNGSKGHFYVTSLGLSDDIDYNNLGNRPIENLIGSLAEPIILDEQTDGIYKISGQYKISNNLDTVFSNNNTALFYVEIDNDEKYIKKVQAKDTVIYKIANGEVTQDKIVTEQYLKEYGFATQEDIEKAISGLDTHIQETTKEYVADYLNDESGGQLVLADAVEQKINEVIVPVDDSDISNIFS